MPKSNMLVDGKALAQVLYTEMRATCKTHKTPPVLGIFAIAPTPETASFIRIKRNRAAELDIQVLERVLPESTTTEEAQAVLAELIREADGIVVQQPLPPHIANDVLCAQIPPKKDIDALTVESVHASPVACAVAYILTQHQVPLAGAHAVVVGSGKLVGKPVAKYLTSVGAEVVVMTKDTGLDEAILKRADIIVSGAGTPGLITPAMVREGVVLIDAGTSESRGAIVGDIDPACGAKAALMSAVPGGVGPVTVACLFGNLLKAAAHTS